MNTIIETPSEVGMIFPEQMTFEQWGEVGERFGEAARRFSWAVGDWLVHGQTTFKGRISAEAFEEAAKNTGMDKQTVLRIATVCRRIPIAQRVKGLSFEHHQAIAILLPKPESRKSWLGFVEQEKAVPSLKLLRLSISCFPDAPRVITSKEYDDRNRKTGSDNYLIHVTRLLTILRKTMSMMDDDEKEALRVDTQDLMIMLDSL
jgi:hypothetical protein